VISTPFIPCIIVAAAILALLATPAWEG
jgi:hypothetical protein